MMAFVLALVMTVASSGPLSVRVTTQLDAHEALIGSPIELTVTARWGDDVSDVRPAWGDRLGVFQITQVRVGELVTDGRERERTWTVRLLSFTAGPARLPPLRFHIQPAQGAGVEIGAGEAIALNVATVTVDRAGDIKPLKPLLSIPWDLVDVALALSALAAVMTIGVWGRRIRSRRQRRRSAPVRDALAALDALERELPATADDVPAFYAAASDVLRSHLEERYGVRASRLSSREIVGVMTGQPGVTGVAETLKDLFGSIDMVKFGGVTSRPSDVPALLRSLRGVMTSRP